MKKIFFSIVLGGSFLAAVSQETVLPAPPQKGVMYITNANIHVGNGTVINNGTIMIKDGKIEKVGTDVTVRVQMLPMQKENRFIPGSFCP